MLDPLAILTLGFVLGLPHASDPDHVVAVSTIVARQRSVLRASAIGALWGVGHTLTILLVGGAVILLKVAIPTQLEAGAELVVAGMLIALGALNLAGSHRAGDYGTDVRGTGARPFVVGIVHGLAGSAAVALVILTTVGGSDAGWAIAALLLFGLGTVAGMVIVTLLLAMPTVYAAARFPGAGRWLRVGSGVASVLVGMLLAARVAAAM